MHHESLKELGAVFKAKRKELNVSLKEAENSTSIRSGYLEAIEEGCIDQFISAVYALGFIRQYAAFLGLDIDRLARDIPGAFVAQPAKHEFAYGIGTLEMRGSMGGGVKWLPNLLWGSLGVAALIVAWYLLKFLEIL